MRNLMIGTMVAVLAGCTPEAKEAASPPVIMQAEDDRFERWQARERAYEAELATAPVYRSAIRDELVENPARFRVSDRGQLDVFRGLEPEFRCPHSPAAIAAAKEDGWQLVKCGRGVAYFFRERDEPARCRPRGPTAPDLYETLVLVFRDAPLDISDKRILDIALSPAMPSQTMSRAEAERRAGKQLPDADRYADCVGPGDCIMLFENGPRRVVKLFFNDGSCPRAAEAAKLVGEDTVALEAPFESHVEATLAIEKAAAYLAAQ
ncbi:hypothetical protein [Sphingomicrobium aestuariivivum]|uniref:hypothetical protein n=1 Tax=Sphingomicrobium aestuariivivum TaxID=1582356 RepID=UPI001FD67CE2|nr:hypothetical protein [Sphingomicrobium aestuariivivum]MCJ8190728.1 hypothetical protein [Sphingomicrobium aestuariivivum]